MSDAKTDEADAHANQVVRYLLSAYGVENDQKAVACAVLVLAKLGRGLNTRTGRSAEEFVLQVEESLRTLFELPRSS